MFYIGNAVTDIGNIKKINQDSLTLKIANSTWGMVCLAVMCDGLGGLAQGEVASAAVVRAFDQWFRETFPKKEDAWNEKDIQEAWEQLLLSINQEIIEYGKENSIQLGTTVTAVLFIKDRYYAIHVGDCRLYEIKKDIRQITRDQSVLAREVEQGRMSEEEARWDARKNVLLQCVGINEHIMPDFISGKVETDATYLVCSDGFRHQVSTEEIFDACHPHANQTSDVIKERLNKLVQLDKAREERDNLSAILVYAGDSSAMSDD